MTISRGRRTRLLVAVAVPALMFGACGDADGGGGGGDVEAGKPADFEASPAYLAQVVEESTSQPYRFEATMSVDAVQGLGGSQEVPILSGSSDGRWVHQRVDIEPLMEEVAEVDGAELPFDLDEVDLATDIVADDHTVYVRAPDYEVIADGQGRDGTDPLVEAVTALGDEWGRVDLDALGDEIRASGVWNLLDAGQDVDPTMLLNMVANASGAEELDSEEVDGEPMAGVAADVSLTEMLEAQGMDTEAVLDRLESQPGAPFDVREAMLGFAVPMEVRIDADGHVRRLTQDVGEALADLADEIGEDPSQLGILNTVFTIDFGDYGDPSIEVPVPDPADTVDITDAFQAVDVSSGGD